MLSIDIYHRLYHKQFGSPLNALIHIEEGRGDLFFSTHFRLSAKDCDE